MKHLLRGVHRYRVCVLLLILMCLWPLARVEADGGAPNLAYVAGTRPGISVIDVGKGQVTRTITLTGDQHMILLSLDGRFLYVTRPQLGLVSVLAAKTGQEICSAHLKGEPSLLALEQSSNTLYAAGAGSTTVTAFDALSCQTRRTFNTTGPVSGLALAAAGVNLSNHSHSQLWIASTGGLSIFDTATGQLLGNVVPASGAYYLSIPPGFFAYMTTTGGSIEAVDIKTHALHHLLTGGQSGPMDYDALTGEVYVPDSEHNLLLVLTPFDPAATSVQVEPERVIHTAQPPTSVAITNDGLLGFVAFKDGSVAMLDLIGRHIVYTVAVSGNPHFVITGLYPPAYVVTHAGVTKQSGSTLPLYSAVIAAVLLALLVLLALGLFWLRTRRSFLGSNL